MVSNLIVLMMVFNTWLVFFNFLRALEVRLCFVDRD